MKNILSILNNDKEDIKTRYARVKASSEMMKQLDDFTKIYEPSSFAEKVYILRYGYDDCQHDKRKNFIDGNVGYRFCGRATSCLCAKDNHSEKIAAAKKRMTADDIRQANNRRKHTCQKKYGVEFNSQHDDVKKKKEETCVRKFGETTNLKTETNKKKVRNTNIEKYGCESSQQRHISSATLETLNDKETLTALYEVNFDVVGVSNQLGVAFSTVYNALKRFNVGMKNGSSLQEKELQQFVLGHVAAELNTRSIISPYELDVYIPQHKLAIEFDGLFWHSSWKLEKNYHLNKTKLCKEKNIQLIHIFEDEWVYKQDIVKSRLLNLIGKTPRKIYARKTKIITPSKQEVRAFLEENHIQGYVGSPIAYGLEHESELVSLMTFGKSRYSKNANYELLRFCNKLNTSVVGGASKLLHAFDKEHGTPSLVSYADLRWSTGNLYHHLGFTHTHDSPPNYWYVKKDKRETRQKYQKHKLPTLLKNFDALLTEKQNMENHNMYQIHDVGNGVWFR